MFPEPLAIYDIAWATFDVFVVGPATTHPRSREEALLRRQITVRNEPELAPLGGFESAAPQLAGRAVGAHNQLAFLRALRLTAGGGFSLAGFASILALGVSRTSRLRRIKRRGRACGGGCLSSLGGFRGTKRRADVWLRFDYRDHFNLRKRSVTGAAVDKACFGRHQRGLVERSSAIDCQRSPGRVRRRMGNEV